jgi:tRNA(fMet)-specific endonuclease VapC
MKYLLDTNTVIRHLNQRSEAITAHLRATDEADVALCSVVKAEMYYGSMHSQRPEENLQIQRQFFSRFVSLPFDDSAAEHYGAVRAHLAEQGTPIGPNDLMLAAIALANDLILVTHNIREFNRVPNLKFEDWEIPL